jgi:RNA polymerase sigma factor (sigma-70 family)
MNSELSNLRLESLVAKAQGGDGNAFEQLIAQTNPLLRRIVAGLIPDHQLREDALQEMWKVVFSKLPRGFSYSGEAGFIRWLKKILRYKSLEILRNRRRRVTSPLLSESDDGSVVPMEPADEHSLTPEQAASREETRERVRKCVDLLPAGPRQAILWYELFNDNGYTLPEVAQQLGVPLGTIKSHLTRARELLRECLAREDLDPQNPPSVLALDKSS